VDSTQLKKMKRFRGMFRFIGVMFCLVGGMFLLSFVPLLLDPEATINFNGTLTSEFGPKLSVVIFVSSFVVVGLLSLFSPARYLNKMFVWRLSFLSTILPRRK
jgi:hypothetical protein